MRARGAEVIEQLALAVEDLHHAPQRIRDVEIAFRVDTDPFGPEHGPRTVADLSHGKLKTAGAVEDLNTEVHGIDDHQVRSIQQQLGWEIELALGFAGLADGPEYIALHVENKDLVAQRVGDKNPLRSRVHGNAGGPLEITLAAFQAADGMYILSAGLEDKDHARFRIGYVNIVLGIDRDALRHEHRVLRFSLAFDELVLMLREIEDVHARRAG